MDRVCMIVQSLYPSDPRVRREAETLARQGIAVDVICMRAEDQPRRETFGLVSAHRVMRVRPKESIARYLWTATRFAVAAGLHLQRLGLTRRYRLIEVHNMPDFLLFAAAPQRLFGKPLLFDMHDLSVELFASKWGSGRKRRLLAPVRWIERLACAFAHRVMTTSEGFRDRLVSRGVDPAKITLLLNTPDSRIFGFDPARRFEPIAAGARLLYHGTVQPRFGILTAIEALALLDKRVPDSTLEVYGAYDPAYRLALESRIAELGLTGRVTLNGYRSLEEINRLIAEADIGLVPYHDDAFMRLALSTKTFEYATCGLPIVASALPSIQTYFDETCVEFAPPADAAGIADAVARLCAEPERRRRLTGNARARLEPISEAVMSRRYLALVSEMMNGRPHPRPQHDPTAAQTPHAQG